jgi:hypothetical protein
VAQASQAITMFWAPAAMLSFSSHPEQGAVLISMPVGKGVPWTDSGNGTKPSAIEFDLTRFPYSNSEN